MNVSDASALLTISTSAGTIEIRGPSGPPAGLMQGIEVGDHGHLSITGAEEVAATYLDAHGIERVWQPELRSGPVLYEEVTYHLWIDGKDHAPSVHHRDPLFTRDITLRPEHRSAAGTFNLQRQVGLLPISVQIGPMRVDLELEVVPTKIDYTTDYQELVTEVASAARGLALAYLRSTHANADHSDERATEIEWLTTLRQEIGELRRALWHINDQPYRHLLRQARPTPNYKIRRLDSVARRAITRGKGSGPVDEVDGVGPVRRTIDSVTAVVTLDTPEHRWLHLHLRLLHQQLRAIAAVLDQEARRPSSWLGERRKTERAEVWQMADRVEHLLDLEVLRHAERLPQPSAPSLTLIGAPGYRDAYRILTQLRLGLSVGGAALELQAKDIHDLYELWSFTEVVRIVATLTGTQPDPMALIRHYSGGLRVDLRTGVLSEVGIAGESRTFTVSYNRVYPGQTGDQKPDIVIRVRDDDGPDLIIVLDAKYRVDATNEFRTRFGAPGPPIDAVNALHRYRDAIVTESPVLVRPVVRCAALFPLTPEETPAYAESSVLYASLESLGVGALPFLPGNVDLATKWLHKLLTLPTAQLAWNGPRGPAVITTRGVDLTE